MTRGRLRREKERKGAEREVSCENRMQMLLRQAGMDGWTDGLREKERHGSGDRLGTLGRVRGILWICIDGSSFHEKSCITASPAHPARSLIKSRPPSRAIRPPDAPRPSASPSSLCSSDLSSFLPSLLHLGATLVPSC